MSKEELLSDLLNERIKLAERIESLRIYTEENDFDSTDKHFSKEQLKSMRDYLEALTNRIKHYEE